MLISIAIIFIVSISSYKLYTYIKNNIKQDNMVKSGVLVIKDLENNNISNIQNKIDNIKKEQMNKNVQNNTKQKKSKNNKKIFENIVFMGDSLVEPLEEYNYLSSSSVIATKGRNVITANEKDVNSVIRLKPNKIVMLYGMNDLSMFKYKNDFINNYKKLINNIKRNLPGTEIYVNNIFKTQEKVWTKDRNFAPERINEFNSALKSMCDELNVSYIDVGFLFRNNSNLYEPDGIHLVANFYPKWLSEISKRLINKRGLL